MSVMSHAARACQRALRGSLRFLFRAARMLFILALVALPIPVAAFVAVILKPNRRNLPAQVLRKDQA
jgi:hypothetical protein